MDISDNLYLNSPNEVTNRICRKKHTHRTNSILVTRLSSTVCGCIDQGTFSGLDGYGSSVIPPPSGKFQGDPALPHNSSPREQ